MGAGLGKSVALITDGRFLEVWLLSACHRSFGGVECISKEWRYHYRCGKTQINLKISDEEFASRKQIGFPESKIKKRIITKIYQVSFVKCRMCNR
jgi:dihydroxyacid dehydratase/phosphogluconate dehydratase